MRKLFLITLISFGLISCSDDDNTSPELPVTNIELPQSDADHPIKSGETITIKGKGFEQSAEIWIKSQSTKSTASEDVKAEVTSVTSSGISFIAPSVSGEKSIVLKQNNQEQLLGKMFFEDSDTPSVQSKRLKNIKSGDDGSEYVYNDKGLLAQVIETYSKKGTYRTEFEYNAKGELIKVTEYDLEESEKGVVDEIITIEYKDSKNIEVRDISPGYEEENRTKRLVLNDKKQVVQMTMIFDDMPGKTSIYTYTYDAQGNIIRVINRDSHMERSYVYTYDDKKSYAQYQVVLRHFLSSRNLA